MKKLKLPCHRESIPEWEGRADLINKITAGHQDEIATAFFEWPHNDRKGKTAHPELVEGYLPFSANQCSHDLLRSWARG